jgi:hypothetical protein
MPRLSEMPRFTSPNSFGSISIPGTRVGGFLSLGLVVIAWFVIPLARPFILGTAGFGSVLGLFLWWRHDKSGYPGDAEKKHF